MVYLYTSLRFSLIYTTLLKMGYSKKSPQKVCLDFSLYPTERNPRENKLSPLEILQNCVTPVGPGPTSKFHMSFSYSTFFLIDTPGGRNIFTCFFFSCLKLHVIQQTFQPCKVLSLENLAKKLLKTWRFSENPEVFSGTPLCSNKFKSTLNKVSYH